jgi:hypothetical protein
MLQRRVRDDATLFKGLSGNCHGPIRRIEFITPTGGEHLPASGEILEVFSQYEYPFLYEARPLFIIKPAYHIPCPAYWGSATAQGHIAAIQDLPLHGMIIGYSNNTFCNVWQELDNGNYHGQLE